MAVSAVKIIFYLTGLVWVISETAYFGWNAYPKSFAELCCDAVAILMLVVALTYEGV